MTASPKAITAIEYTWARATLGTIYPACPEAGVTQGITDMDLAAHIDDMDESLPWMTFFGFRLFLLIIALSPLFVIGKFGTMAGIAQEDRDAVIGRLGHSNVYLVRQMVMALELLFHIDQVFVHGIESASEETAEVDADGGILGEEIGGIGDEVEACRRGRSNGGGVGHGHESGEIAEDGAGFIGFGDDDAIFDDFDAAFDEEVDVAGAISLG
jgi:hypothetical protein